MIVQVKQPDKIELDNWPTLPMLRPYLQHTYAAWRVLTGGADHAEDYLRVAERKAKESDIEYLEQLEECRCTDYKYSLA